MKFIILAVAVYYAIAQKTDERISTTTSSNSTALADVSTMSTPHLENTNVDLNMTTEMTLTTCDVNCSISTEEPMLNATVPGPRNVTSKGDVSGKTSELKTLRNNEPCVCDLQLNFCDINCCCDPDCSSEDKLIFHHCEKEHLYYDTRYCDYMKYIYINNTPFEWHVNQNGFFCVIKSNLPPSYTIQRKQPLTSFVNAESEKHDKFFWAKHSVNKNVVFNSTEHFTHGSNIWIISRNGSKKLKKLQLPKKLLSNICAIKEDVLNLVNVRHTCAQIDISEETAELSFSSFFQNLSIVAAPHLLNISRYKNLYEECPRNICLPIFPRICDENFNACENISRNDTRLVAKCKFDIRLKTNTCENVVRKLQYNIYHNGVKGYSKIELLGVLDTISYEYGKQDFELYQDYSIHFWWTNQTRNFSAILSGNPGYMIGKPILVGDMINVGNKTNVILKIERFSDDYARTFMTLPENVNGNCVLDNKTYLPIEFGYNLLTRCKFNSTVFNRKKYLNGTEICRYIQKAVLSLWRITGTNKTVGMFGNANANNPEEWIKILYSISLENLMNKTMGQFDKSNNTVTCFGIVTNLIINVYHSKINLKNVLNQEKILGVTYSFEGLKNKTFIYNKQKNSTFFEFDLESQVVFYDITVQKQRRFVDPPSLEIKLPYDFFYPFIKIENDVDKISANYFLCIYMCLLLVFSS